MALVTYSINLLLIIGLSVGEASIDNLEYVGCFDLRYSIGKHYHHVVLSSNLEKCVIACRYLGSPRYVGVESSDGFCYCGEDIAEKSTKKEDNKCNLKCSDVNSKTCGGNWVMSLYVVKTNTTKPKDSVVSVPFLTTLSSEVRVYKPSSQAEYNTVMTVANNNKEWAYTVDYHYAKKLVFTNTRNKLVRGNVSPTFEAATTTPSVVRNLTESCDGYGFAVDWVADKIYWADCISEGNKSIMKMNLDGTHNEKVVSVEGLGEIRRMEVDPYRGMLFWMADREIKSLNLASKEYHNDIIGEEIVQEFSLDRSAKKVYYIGSTNTTRSLFSIDYTGKNKIKICTASQMERVSSMAIHGGFVYWLNREFYKGIAMPTLTIYRAPLRPESGCSLQTVRLLNKSIWHMRILHPDIQKQSQ